MKREKIALRKVIPVFAVISVFVFGFIMYSQQNLFAKCEAALARLQQAEAQLNAANAAFNNANQKAKQAQADLAQAVADLNAVAARLGAQGKASEDSAVFGSSPSNPSFFDDPSYKAAMQAWQDAKTANEKAQGELDMAGVNRMRAYAEYDAAKSEYERLRLQHIGDQGLMRVPKPIEIDEGLGEKVEGILQKEGHSAGSAGQYKDVQKKYKSGKESHPK